MKRSLLGVAVALTLTGCSLRDANEPLEVWNTFDQPKISTEQLGENQSLLVFFREGDIQGPAANIYINGNYQASLLSNAVTPVAVCSAQNLLTTSFSSNAQFGNRSQGVNYTLPVGEVSYVKMIQESNGNLNFLRVSAEEAQQVVANLPKENQTLSRVPAPANCGEPILANETLDASALFAFNKSSARDILPKGKREIDEFVQKIGTFRGVTRIEVSGHTDPVGSEKYNRVLSQKRAETVKAILIKSGVNAPIEAIGYGESKPVVTHCSALKGKAKEACNEPNRRVDITVYGNR